MVCHFLGRAAVLLGAALGLTPALAAWEPVRPVEFVVPAGTGGGADQMARFLQGLITKNGLMKQPMVVVNKSGGAGGEGFLDMKGSRGNPHKLVISLSNLFTTPLSTGLPFSWQDLTPVSMLALDQFVLWVNADSPYKTAKAYLDAARAGADGAFKMAGTGSRQEDQIITVALEKAVGRKFTYVPFKGGGDVAVQLVGNHEAQYLRAPTFEWHQRLDGETIAILRRWWGDGLMTVATVVPAGDADLLVTHAGLTEGFWRADLGQPASAVRAAEMLNMMGALGRTSIFRGGAMLGGSRSASAGPMWASASMELLPSWLGRRMPFGQIHGHSSAYDWQRECFRAAEAIAARTRLDHDCGHEITSFDGGEIVGIDPGHGAHVPHPWQAWVTSAA